MTYNLDKGKIECTVGNKKFGFLNDKKAFPIRSITAVLWMLRCDVIMLFLVLISNQLISG